VNQLDKSPGPSELVSTYLAQVSLNQKEKLAQAAPLRQVSLKNRVRKVN